MSKLITKPEAPGATIKTIVTRLIAGLVVFLLPTLISNVDIGSILKNIKL